MSYNQTYVTVGLVKLVSYARKLPAKQRRVFLARIGRVMAVIGDWSGVERIEALLAPITTKQNYEIEETYSAIGEQAARAGHSEIATRFFERTKDGRHCIKILTALLENGDDRLLRQLERDSSDNVLVLNTSDLLAIARAGREPEYALQAMRQAELVWKKRNGITWSSYADELVEILVAYGFIDEAVKTAEMMWKMADHGDYMDWEHDYAKALSWLYLAGYTKAKTLLLRRSLRFAKLKTQVQMRCIFAIRTGDVQTIRLIEKMVKKASAEDRLKVLSKTSYISLVRKQNGRQQAFQLELEVGRPAYQYTYLCYHYPQQLKQTISCLIENGYPSQSLRHYFDLGVTDKYDLLLFIQEALHVNCLDNRRWSLEDKLTRWQEQQSELASTASNLPLSLTLAAAYAGSPLALRRLRAQLAEIKPSDERLAVEVCLSWHGSSRFVKSLSRLKLDNVLANTLLYALEYAVGVANGFEYKKYFL